MIDLNAVKCVGIMGAAVLVGYVLLRLFEWGWGNQGKRPLKEKSPKQKAQEKKRTRRAAQYMADAPESRWMRPGGPLQPSRRPAPIFGEGQPRHIRIDDTPHVIIPHETVGPVQDHDGTQGRLMRVVKIDRVDVNAPEQPAASSPKDIKPNKLDKSNRTM